MLKHTAFRTIDIPSCTCLQKVHLGLCSCSASCMYRTDFEKVGYFLDILCSCPDHKHEVKSFILERWGLPTVWYHVYIVTSRSPEKQTSVCHHGHDITDTYLTWAWTYSSFEGTRGFFETMLIVYMDCQDCSVISLWAMKHMLQFLSCLLW